MRESVRKVQKKKRNEKDKKTVEKWQPKGGKSLMVAGDLGPWSPATMGARSLVTMEIRVVGFLLKAHFSGSFLHFEMIGPRGFPKI